MSAMLIHTTTFIDNIKQSGKIKLREELYDDPSYPCKRGVKYIDGNDPPIAGAQEMLTSGTLELS